MATIQRFFLVITILSLSFSSFATPALAQAPSDVCWYVFAEDPGQEGSYVIFQFNNQESADGLANDLTESGNPAVVVQWSGPDCGHDPYDVLEENFDTFISVFSSKLKELFPPIPPTGQGILAGYVKFSRPCYVIVDRSGNFSKAFDSLEAAEAEL